MKIIKVRLDGKIMFFQENDMTVKPLYFTIREAIEAGRGSCGIIFENGEVVALGKSIGFISSKEEVLKETVDYILEDIEVEKEKK